ncbi:MAG: UDP-4-amino-4,6-dideoxy-N-acetyl-beta-L-altrosamine N-acetyltransferase [Flavobacteriales bacterium]|jgi:UDP-4-amino-4,6-dideoxy-N-acetyl-beta-L-altrosamine N-acetyltransferase
MSTNKQTVKSTIKSHSLHESFFMGNIELRNFCNINREEALMVWEWRNHPAIRKWMYHSDIIPQENHFLFLKNLSTKTDNFYWLILEEGEYLGVINFSNFENHQSEWGFYLNPGLFGKGKSIHLIFNALNFFFKKLELTQVYGFVRSDNCIALKFHDFMGIQKTGTQHIKVKGVNVLFEKREMTRERWLKGNYTLQYWKDAHAEYKAKRKRT